MPLELVLIPNKLTFDPVVYLVADAQLKYILKCLHGLHHDALDILKAFQ